MDELTFFRAKRINSRITRIKGITEEMMYLIEGNDKAALIDTGVGLGNIRTFVDQLTDKPIVVLITHAHVDHVMGASLFEDVYLSPADFHTYEDHRRTEKRRAYLKRFMGKKYELLKDEDFIEAPPLKFHALNEGDLFDLGGLTLEIFNAPGHSMGSVALLLHEERILIPGDACNTLTMLFEQDSPSIEEYRDQLINLREKTHDLYDRVLVSHYPGEAPADLIDSVISVCDDILQGRSEEIPFKFMELTLVAAKKLSAGLSRADGGLGNVVYIKDNVRRIANSDPSE